MSAISKTSVAVLFFSLLLTVACGGGGSNSAGYPPVFIVPTPGSASEGAPFTYTLQATDPQGGNVSFEIVSGPTGATLSGATISWTPTHAQSRQANQFTVRATSSSGGTATTSFNVTPAGTIHGTSVVTYWNKTTSQQVPNDLSSNPPQILVPNGSSYVTYAGQGAADGSFSIPNVPAGYYWLQYPTTALYWTNSNDVDLGLDFARHTAPASSAGSTYLYGPTTITGNFNVSDMEPWANNVVTIPTTVSDYTGLAGFSPEAGVAISVNTVDANGPIIPDGATSLIGQLPIYVPVPIDAGAGDTTYFLQSHNSFLSGNWIARRVVKALGPLQLTVDDSTTSVDISGQFQAPQPSSTRFNIKAAGFSASVNGTNPTAGSSMLSGFSASTLAVYDTGRYAPVALAIPSIPGLFRSGLALADLSMSSSFGAGPLITDFDAGDVSFVNPYPGATVPLYAANQQAFALIYQSGNSRLSFAGYNGYTTTTTPTATKPFDLPMGNVQSPQINGTSLFQATQVSQPITLTWQAPVGLTPSGYQVNVVGFAFPTTCPGSGTYIPPVGSFCPEILSSMRLVTTGTSVSIPPGLLQDGVQYVFTIHAISDSATDFLKAPNRGSWNRAYSDVVSSLITVGAAAPAPSAAPVRMNMTGAIKSVFVVRDSNGEPHISSCKDVSEASCAQ